MLATTNPAQSGRRLTDEQRRAWADFLLRAYLERPKGTPQPEKPKEGGR
jgi:hypothetical protein